MIAETFGRLTKMGTLRRYAYNLDVRRDVACFVARERYAWPGGYALLLVTDDGATLCSACVRAHFRTVLTSYAGDGWHPAGVTTADLCERGETCDHCGRELNPED